MNTELGAALRLRLNKTSASSKEWTLELWADLERGKSCGENRADWNLIYIVRLGRLVRAILNLLSGSMEEWL